MNTKLPIQSRTFWAIIATAAVLAAEQVAPAAWQPYLTNVQHILELMGLWFCRLGAGTPIVIKQAQPISLAPKP